MATTKAIAHAKNSVWVKKKNCLKHVRNVSTNTLELLYKSNGSKKQLIFEKSDNFENGQKWPQSKGYSPCKILTLGQKIKFLKLREKHLYKHIRVVLCKTLSQKTANIQKMRAFSKWPKMATHKGYRPCKILTLGQKIKLLKTHKKHLY